MSNRRKLKKPAYGKPISSHDKPNLNPRLVSPRPDAEGRTQYIVLDIVDPAVEPPYCTHGKTTCNNPSCGEWLWLGHESYEMVSAGEAVGICMPCATKFMPPGARPHRRVEDRLHHD